MKPICRACGLFFRMKEASVYFTEGMQVGDGAIYPPSPNAKSQDWKPYKLWAGDLWECRGCGAQIISGFGARPIAEHYKSDFAELAKSLGATFQVNDC